MNFEKWVALFSFLLGLIPSLIGIFIWYGNAEKRKYAAARDMQHLKSNQEAISTAIGLLDDEIEELRDQLLRELTEIKALAFRQLLGDKDR